MDWTKITRERYSREGLCYASDLKDEEWALLEPKTPGASADRASADAGAALGDGSDPVHGGGLSVA